MEKIAVFKKDDEIAKLQEQIEDFTSSRKRWAEQSEKKDEEIAWLKERINERDKTIEKLETRLGKLVTPKNHIQCDYCGAIWAIEFKDLGRKFDATSRHSYKSYWACPYHDHIPHDKMCEKLNGKISYNSGDSSRWLTKEDKIKLLQSPIVKMEMINDMQGVLLTLADGTKIETGQGHLRDLTLRMDGGVLAVLHSELLNESRTLHNIYTEWQRDCKSLEKFSERWEVQLSTPELPDQLKGYESFLGEEAKGKEDGTN